MLFSVYIRYPPVETHPITIPIITNSIFFILQLIFTIFFVLLFFKIFELV